MPISDSPRVIHSMYVMHCRWTCQWPIGLHHTTTDSGYQCQKLMCVTACVYIRRHRGWFMPRQWNCHWVTFWWQPQCSSWCDILWVGHRVGLWCILTVHLLSEILGIASIKVASWHIHTEPIQPLGTTFPLKILKSHLYYAITHWLKV